MISRSQLIKSPQIYRYIFQFPHLNPVHCQISEFSSSSNAFSSFQDSEIPNLAKHRDWLSPNEMIKIFEKLKDPNFILPVLEQIRVRKDYKPNEALYTAVINKLAKAKNFDAIETLMERIKHERKCRLSEDFFYNVMKIYGNLGGKINSAMETLFEMHNYKCWPTVKTFNFVLNLLVSSKQFEIVHEVYRGASELGVEVDACSLNIIIKGLCECGELDAAYLVLDEFPNQKCSPNVRSFSTIIHGLCEQGRLDQAFALLDRMEREGVDPDAVTFNILISGLRKQGRTDEGIQLLDRMMRKGCDPNSGTYQQVLYALLDAKKFAEAKAFMHRMISKGVYPSFESYKSIIHGFCDEALVSDLDWVLKQMVRQGFVPKMGMWKRILECIFSGSTSTYNSCSYKEIIGK